MSARRTTAERLEALLADPEFVRLINLPNPKVSSQELYVRLLSDHVAPLMRQSGYKRRRNSWGRETIDGWLVIDFQACSFSNRHELRFTVNLGYFSHAVAIGLREKPRPSTPPPDNMCHYRERIGRLIQPHRDIWWTVLADRPIDETAARILRVLERFVLPHMEALSTDEFVLRRMLDPKVLPEQMPRPVLALMAKLRPSSALRKYGGQLYKMNADWTRSMWDELGLPRALLQCDVAKSVHKRK